MNVHCYTISTSYRVHILLFSAVSSTDQNNHSLAQILILNSAIVQNNKGTNSAG